MLVLWVAAQAGRESGKSLAWMSIQATCTHLIQYWLDYLLAPGLKDKSGQSNEEGDAGQEGCRKGEEVWGLVIGDL